MDIIPSIDLRAGKCVRLYQGDYRQETVFSDDPLDVALKWQSLGAPRLHLVDLDGAASGEISNMEIIRNITGALLIPVQLGGGIRCIETIETLLKNGIDRVILGTAAVEDPQLISDACRRYRDSVIVGIDARRGLIATRGWVNDTGLTAVELAQSMVKLGVRRFIYTDIERDGTLTEPNFSAIAGLIDTLGLPVIAAGGISTLNHLRMLQKLGAEGAIIGKALYTGDIKLKQAISEIDRV
ncbi:MAG: 1-(5-phosphoribosyl)-5-[(5-phosphoribosylamino)methylideneamino]imidazole-4-carboxamide isomerase [Chloroflexi bacterium RBG_13_51_18]|nr:MAG: 1-(5-phosphoribosyl)-5-[(5-phosphoribosylamino)methylideneamino]imidazole-4-carboxamide isomerase [Chloroflexi bacterium RBG_13_51_18]